MIETATVTTIDGELVTVACVGERCDGCSSSFCSLGDRRFVARNGSRLPLEPNDTVEVYVAPTRAVGASFLALIVPLVLFVGCYAVAAAIGVHSELARALLGLLGVGAGIGLNVLYGKTRAGKALPEIVRVLRG